jgi:hypothetical protein
LRKRQMLDQNSPSPEHLSATGAGSGSIAMAMENWTAMSKYPATVVFQAAEDRIEGRTELCK